MQLCRNGYAYHQTFSPSGSHTIHTKRCGNIPTGTPYRDVECRITSSPSARHEWWLHPRGLPLHGPAYCGGHLAAPFARSCWQRTMVKKSRFATNYVGLSRKLYKIGPIGNANRNSSIEWCYLQYLEWCLTQISKSNLLIILSSVCLLHLYFCLCVCVLVVLPSLANKRLHYWRWISQKRYEIRYVWYGKPTTVCLPDGKKVWCYV